MAAPECCHAVAGRASTSRHEVLQRRF